MTSRSKQLHIGRGFHLPVEAVTETFAYLAKRGAGKSYNAGVVVEEMLAAGFQVVIIDPMGTWSALRTGANGKSAGFPIAVLGGDHGDIPLESTAGVVVADMVAREHLSVVLDVSTFSKGERKRFVETFAEELYRRNRDPLHLVLEEADLFAPQRPQPGEQRMLGAVEDLVRRGRARGIGVTLITQRAAVLNKDVLTQTECLVALRTTSPQDRKAIEAWIDVVADRAERDRVLKSLPSLGERGKQGSWDEERARSMQRDPRSRSAIDSAALRLGDASGARGRGHTGAVPREEAQSDSERFNARRLPDELVPPGSVDGSWEGAEWWLCRDGTARPAEPGTFPLVDGAPARVGRLRAYGNAIVPQVAAAFVRASVETIRAEW